MVYKIIDDRVEQDGHDNGVHTDGPHADTVQLKERETNAGHTRDKGGDNKQKDSDDDSEGDGPKHVKPRADR